MTDMTTLPRRREFTRADLDALPDDGWRHELVDGSLVMSPSPSHRHQRTVLELAVILRAACPSDLEVVIAPFDVSLGIDTVIQPDLLVARRSDLTEVDLPTAPVLAVEVLSPSTRHLDLGLKRSRLEAAHCSHYWVVDPGHDGQPPSLRRWTLDPTTHAYDAPQITHGTDPVRIDRPFPVEFTPADLVD